MKTIREPMHVAVGEFGRWQATISFLMALLKMPIAWFQLVIVFHAPPTLFHCKDSHLQKTPDDNCWVNSSENGAIEKCRSWEYDRSIFSETIITQWDLVCDREHLANVAQTSFMFGVLTGNIIFGVAADRLGRKRPLMAAIALQAMSGMATAFAPWFEAFLAFRFILAVATGGTVITSFVICMELVGGKWRGIIPILYQLPFGMGKAVMALSSYYFRDWRHLQLALSLYSALFLMYCWIVPESPRWLMAVGRYDRAVQILEVAAKRNGMDVTQVNQIILSQKLCTDVAEKKATIVDLFRTRRLRRHTLCVLLAWFVSGVTFFALNQYQGQLGGNIFINIAMSGLVGGLPGPLTCVYVVRRFGRRKTILFAQTFAGITCLLVSVIPIGVYIGDWPRQTLAVLSLVGMSVSYPALYLFSGELFPTVVRNIGIGASSMCSRTGSMIAPFLLNSAAFGPGIPMVVIGTLCLIGAVLVLPLPETRFHALPDSLADGETIGSCVTTPEDHINKNYVQVPTGEI